MPLTCLFKKVPVGSSEGGTFGEKNTIRRMNLHLGSPRRGASDQARVMPICSICLLPTHSSKSWHLGAPAVIASHHLSPQFHQGPQLWSLSPSSRVLSSGWHTLVSSAVPWYHRSHLPSPQSSLWILGRWLSNLKSESDSFLAATALTLSVHF